MDKIINKRIQIHITNIRNVFGTFTSLFLLILSSHTLSGQLFTESAESLGIDHVVRHINFLGGGCALIDIDKDGDDDIYLIGGSNSDKLYANHGDSFEEISFLSGIGLTANLYTTGVVAGDVNNDGLTDLFVTTIGSNEINSKHLLFINQGNNTFSDVWPLLDEINQSIGAIMVDINLDGWLDIYVVNYVDAAGFLINAEGVVYGYDHDCYQNQLFLNDGDGTYTDVSEIYLTATPGCSLAALASDIDDDHDQDIIVGNDYGEWITSNQILENNLDTTLQDIGQLNGMGIGIYTMGICGDDFDQDGDLDYYFTNFGENQLLINNGNTAFTQWSTEGLSSTFNSQDSTMTDLSISWGCASDDFNNDGLVDLYVANGYVPSPDFLPGGVYDQDRLIVNTGDLSFDELTTAASGIDNTNTSRGVVTTDLDRDGDLDLIVNNLNVPVSQSNQIKSQIYINNSPQEHSWIQLGLIGVKSNKDACGAKVKLYVGERTYIQEVYCGQGLSSSGSKILHFGLGQTNQIDSLQILWPTLDQHTDSYYSLKTNERYFFTERVEKEDNTLKPNITPKVLDHD